jgi:hypothetical protein
MQGQRNVTTANNLQTASGKQLRHSYTRLRKHMHAGRAGQNMSSTALTSTAQQQVQHNPPHSAYWQRQLMAGERQLAAAHQLAANHGPT